MDPNNQNPGTDLPDTLTQQIGILTRREVEARILAPIIEAIGEQFEQERVIQVVQQTIIDVARQQGAELAQSLGGCGSAEFQRSLPYWTKDQALELDMIRQDRQNLQFNVTRCRYAEMYTALGIPELGSLLSCSRDHALIQGFNPDASLTRKQTIMEGAPYCDFIYRFPESAREI